MSHFPGAYVLAVTVGIALFSWFLTREQAKHDQQESFTKRTKHPRSLCGCWFCHRSSPPLSYTQQSTPDFRWG